MPQCQCQHQCSPENPRSRGGPIRFIFSLAMLYVLLVFGGGTLINTGHPVAAEVGKLIHVVMFVDPAISWTTSHDLEPVSRGLRMLSAGFPIA